MSGLLEEFNRQIKDETSRKSFAARLTGIYNWRMSQMHFQSNWIWYSSIDRKLGNLERIPRKMSTIWGL
jgi:hypothetical protein